MQTCKNDSTLKILSVAGILCLLSSVIPASLLAQTKSWITETTDNGSVTVKSCISERTDEKGSVLPLIEYIATTTVSVDQQQCISLIKDVSKHKAFLRDVKVSTMVKTISANEWVVYYSFHAPWPFSDYDCVTKMTFLDDTAKNTAVFSLAAAPSMYKSTNEDRLNYYYITYTFKDLGNGNIEITITGKMSPLIKVPRWMLKASMPGHPTEILRKIVMLAKVMKK